MYVHVGVNQDKNPYPNTERIRKQDKIVDKNIDKTVDKIVDKNIDKNDDTANESSKEFRKSVFHKSLKVSAPRCDLRASLMTETFGLGRQDGNSRFLERENGRGR